MQNFYLGSKFLVIVFLIFFCYSCKSNTVKNDVSGSVGLSLSGEPDDSVCNALSASSSTNLALVGTNVSTGLALATEQFITSAQNAIAGKIAQPIQAQPIASSFTSNSGVSHVSFSFFANGVELCQYKVRANGTLEGAIKFSGAFPPSLSPNSIPQNWTDSIATDSAIKQELKKPELESGISEGDIDHDTMLKTKCIIYDNSSKTWQAGWNIHFKMGSRNLPFHALVTSKKVYQASPRFFSQDGAITEQTQTYQKTPLSSTNLVLTSLDLSGVSPASLCSERFKVVIVNMPTDASGNPLGVPLASPTNGKFSFSSQDYRFNQTSVFTNATEHSNWLLQQGILSSWPKPQVELHLDDTNSGVNNTAVYIPPDDDAGTGPHIDLGNGDGIILQNIQIDSDAVYHETGHHVVWQTLQTTTGQSLVIHEALADFFTFGQTNSSCLGNLLCPAGGTLCWTSTCLRTADNTLSFLSPNLPTEAHQESQFISGMLWTIGQQIGLANIVKIVLKAIDYFPIAAQFSDLVAALMEADKVLFNGKHACIIQSAAIARGLQQTMQAAGLADCSTYQ